MITIIFGPPGVGKTALMTYFALRYLEPVQARDDVLSSREIVSALNAGGYNFTEPARHFVYSDYRITYRAYNCAPRESFLVNGFRIGLPNSQHEITLVPPGSRIFLSEGQRYFNSRMSSSLGDFVSRYYEMHRHYGLEIYIDVQRAQLIDANLREITARFIEVISLKHKYRRGEIHSSVWDVKEFESAYELEQYFNQGKPVQLGKKNQYKFIGNIFEHYNTTNCFPAFLAGAAGADFSYLPHPRIGYTVKDIEYYNAHLGMEVPPTYYKERSRK